LTRHLTGIAGGAFRLPSSCRRFAALSLLPIGPVHAHGVIGKRFYPATPPTDDPFVADELSLPTVSTLKSNANGDDPTQRDTTIAVDVSKRITPDFAVSLGEAWHHITPDGGSLKTGFGNLEAGLKYQFLKSEA